MNVCLWCDQTFTGKISWRNLFGMADEPLICEECRQSLLFISGEICRYCGRMHESEKGNYFSGDVCYDCIRWEEDPEWCGVLRQNRSLYRYNSFMKALISRYKFRGDVAVIEAVTFDWQRLLKKEFSDEMIVPIPLSDERLYERGFNQSRHLAQLLGVPVNEFLIRPHHEKKQSKKTRDERLDSELLFHMKENTYVARQNILLIDDIYTTGSTVRHAAKTLLNAGASSVSSLTLAR